MIGMLNRKQAAERLGMSVTNLDRERLAGRLAYVQRKRNGRVWIPEEAIAQYITQAMHPAEPERPVRATYRKRRTKSA